MRVLIATLTLLFAMPAYGQSTPHEVQVLAAHTLRDALASESDRTPYDWDEVARALRDVHWRLAGPDEVRADGSLSRTGRLESEWHAEVVAHGDGEAVQEIVVRFQMQGDTDAVISALRAAGVSVSGGDRDGSDVAYAISAPGKRRALLRRIVGCGAGGSPPDRCLVSYVLTYLIE